GHLPVRTVHLREIRESEILGCEVRYGEVLNQLCHHPLPRIEIFRIPPRWRSCSTCDTNTPLARPLGAGTSRKNLPPVPRRTITTSSRNPSWASRSASVRP